jgi:LAS superfamily LD-carboxypeptidase LdcB
MRIVERAFLHGLGDGGALAAVGDGVQLHREVIAPLEAMTAAAARASIGIRVLSGHRSFATQLSIWNRKASGSRTLLDSAEQPLDARTLAPNALIDAILRWSALPGASRHHWGTDMDVYDVEAVGPDFAPELTGDEAINRFGALHTWLDVHMNEYGFYRPYALDLGGVAPEPWHLSYAPLSRDFLAAMTVDSLREVLMTADMALKGQVLERLPELFERYTLRVGVV